VLQLNVTATNGVTSSGFTSTAGATGGDPAATSASGGAAGSAGPAASLQVLDVDTSALAVVIPSTSDATTSAPQIDLKAIVDTQAPVITLKGDAYVSVLQLTSYSDPGVTVYDNIDGNNVNPRKQLKLCSRPDGAEALPAQDTQPLSCSATVYASVNTTVPLDGLVWVYNYTARDTAGNNALPLRRIVEIAPRWALVAVKFGVQAICERVALPRHLCYYMNRCYAWRQA
jgi:hypothetical protein